MAGSLTERLQLVVDATTGQAEAKFAKLGEASAATAKTTTASANQVAVAADRVAQARLKEEQAAGLVRVAEARLDELRSVSGAKASQLVAAEERLAAAQRNLAAATRQTAAATAERSASQSTAVTQVEQLGRSTGVARQALVGLATAGAAFAGIGLVDYLKESVSGFVEGAKTASQLSISMNATVAQAGQFGALAKSIGLDFNDLLEIQAEFAQKVGQNAGLLDSFGAAVKRNDDGTTNWALTLEDALIQLQQIPDATKRNALGFQLFGEEGFKQLSRLLVTGMSVKDALAAIGTPFTEEDVAAVQAYNLQLMELSLTGTRIENTLGRALLPIVATVASGFADFLDVVTQIPLPLAAATLAAIALGVTGFSPAAVAGARLELVMAAVTRQLAYFNVLAATSGRAGAIMGASMTAASAGARGLMGIVGGPFGAALIGASVVYTLASNGAEDFEKHARAAALAVKEAGGTINDENANIRRQAEALAENAGAWERAGMAARGLQEAKDTGDLPWWADLTGSVSNANTLASLFGDTEVAARGAEAGIKDAADELGAYGAQSETAQVTVKTLNDLIAEGTTSGQEFSTAVAAAADAQDRQAQTSGLAKAAMDAYYAVTRDAVQATLDLIGAQLQQSDGLIGVQKAAYELGKTVDDAKTPWNEVTEASNRAIESALSYAQNASDAAVAGAKAQGQIVDAAAEAQIRAQATMAALRESLNAPGLTEEAKAQIQEMITKLDDASKKGDIQAILSLTGVDQAEGQLDQATQDRDTTIKVDSAGGPAVKSYLDGLASQSRLAIVNVESRGGPAVADYLARVTSADRLAIIRVESRNGPAVDAYLDGLAAQDRLAIIRVESRGGPAVDAYLDSLAAPRNAVINVTRRVTEVPAGGSGGPTGMMRGGPAGGLMGADRMGAGPGAVGGVNATIDLHLTGELDRSQISKAGQGRVTVENIRAYERRNGTGWRSDR